MNETRRDGAAAAHAESQDTSERRIGVTTASLLVVASMVGTGVFTTTGFLVRDLQSVWAVLACWMLDGVLALWGALAYAELVTALPRNGGEYQLLSRIYHPALGFVAGCTSLVVGFAAPIALSALAFGSYLQRVAPFTDPLLMAAGLIIVLSIVHALRVSVGAGAQNVLTVIKVVLILGFIVAGLATASFAGLTAPAERSFSSAALSPAFAVSLVYVSFAYSGWNAAAYVAGEVRHPSRNLPLALLVGTAIVMVMYVLLNVVFLASAPLADLSGRVEVGHVAATHLFGDEAGRFVSVVIALGLVSTVGALILTGARVYEAMGEDHVALAVFRRRDGTAGPVASIIAQAVLALVMIFTASFDALLTYVGITLSLFSGLTVLGVFILRKNEPHLTRPYRTWGHPFTTTLFLMLMLWMIVQSILERPLVAAAGAGTVAFVWVLYRFVRNTTD